VQAKDLHDWKLDAEAFHHASDIGGSQENLRTCAEMLYLSLLEVLDSVCIFMVLRAGSWCICAKRVEAQRRGQGSSQAAYLLLQRNRERVAPLVLGALQRACEAAPPGGTASLPGPHVGGVPVCSPASVAPICLQGCLCACCAQRAA
jgi:hypothetical protein